MKPEIVEELFSVVVQYGASLAIQSLAGGLTQKQEVKLEYLKDLVRRYREAKESEVSDG